MDIETLRVKYEALSPVLTERTRRLWAASEAEAMGHGGIAMVARATGMSRARIARGIEELHSEEPLDPSRTRRPGGGRKRTIDTDETLLSDLDALLEPITAGEPDDSPLRPPGRRTTPSPGLASRRRSVREAGCHRGSSERGQNCGE